jgi:hypothetical protein
MAKPRFLTSGLSLLFIPFFLFITSCKKDTDPQQGPVRLRSIYYLWTGQQNRKVVDSIVYVDNRLARTITYEDNGSGPSDPSSEIQYTYNGNEIIAWYYWVHPMDSLTLNRKITYEVTNNHVTSMLNEPVGQSEAAQRRICEYDQDLMIRETSSYRYIDGSWEDDNKYEFFYKDNLVDSMVVYVSTGGSNWQKSGKQVFEYAGGNITRLVHYTWSSNTYIQDAVTPYTYSGPNLVTIGSGVPAENFQYNDLGFLKLLDDGNPYFSTKTYQYESGSGNAAFIKYLSDPVAKLEQDPRSTHVP